MNGALRLHPVLLLALILLPAVSLGQELPAWTDTIRADHPRLFFNAETWPEVRARALGAEREWYQSIKDRTDRLLSRLSGVDKPKPQELGAEAAAAAFVFLMTDDREYLDLAKKCLAASLDYYDQCFQQKKTVNWYSTSRSRHDGLGLALRPHDRDRTPHDDGAARPGHRQRAQSQTVHRS